MKFLKKKVLRPFRHVYTEDDYKWVGRRSNYDLILRRFTDEEIIKFYFIIKTHDRDDSMLIYNSKDDGVFYESLESVEKAAIEYVG